MSTAETLNAIAENAFDDEMKKLATKPKSKFKIFQDNKVALTPEEHKEVIDRKAVWHNNPNGGVSSAVWKSVHPKTGKVTYITNTHRAWNQAPSLKGAIGRYHKFIKGTA